MVVMGHVITMCIRDIDQTTLFKFIGEIHMPLFFFISGWFTYKVNKKGILKSPDLGRRFRQLIIPMIVVSTLWLFYFPHSGLQTPIRSTFLDLWFSEFKNGYWFPLTLFEIVILYAVMRPFLGNKVAVCKDILVTVCVWIVLIILNIVLYQSMIGLFIGIEMLATYWPVFMIGFISSKNRESFARITSSGYANTVALLAGGFLLYYICWWWEFPGAQYIGNSEINLVFARPLFHICLAIVATAIFKSAVNSSLQQNPKTRWVRIWSYLGKKSLGIYLLHYFFLFPMGCLRPVARDFHMGFAPMFLISVIFSAVIIIVVLGVIRVISISPLLSWLLTGTLPPKNN